MTLERILMALYLLGVAGLFYGINIKTFSKPIQKRLSWWLMWTALAASVTVVLMGMLRA